MADANTIVNYKQLRDKMGKGAILEWRKICIIFGFDPDPKVTTEITAQAKVEDPNALTPDQIGGPIGPAQGVTVGLDVDGDGVVDQTITIEQPAAKIIERPIAPRPQQVQEDV